MEPGVTSRIRLLFLAVSIMALVVGARLVVLQVFRCEDLRARASFQHRREIQVPATRGAIVDRNGRELAVSLKTESLFAHPRRVGDPREAARLLAPIVGLTEDQILVRLRSDKPFAYIHRFLEPEQARAVRDLDLPVGINEPFGFHPSFKRYYPRGRLGVHVVGFANIDGKGVEGMEARFDSDLRGEPTSYIVLQDGQNGLLRQKILRAPERTPRDVVLSIDLVLQHAAERELDRAMSHSGARAASAVLMDSATGQILALANRPAADANHYGQACAEAKINRAVVHEYEPGSTFKIVSMAAVLEQDKVRPGDRFDCENGLLITGRRRIRDSSPHDMLSALDIMVKSSNIGMVKIARRIESPQLRQTISRFGFGARTGIELPGERAGSLRPIAEWSDYSHDSLAFGHEIGVTVVQMASAFAVVANDGIRIPPRLVLGLADTDSIERSDSPRSHRVISSSTARLLTSMLEETVARGTGTNADLPGYRLAGKTGTAQKLVDGSFSETEYMASFGGFGPVSSPRLVGLVVLDTPDGDRRHGGQVAAPVFARIMESALRYLRVPGDEEIPTVVGTKVATREVSQPRPRAMANRGESPGAVPDLRGLSMREAISTITSRGYRPQVVGTGFVVEQHPAAGTLLARDEPCRVRLEEPSAVLTSQAIQPHHPGSTTR